jgi:hypothetical protein
VLLFIHGVRNDDPAAQWRQALDGALQREGTASLEERGYRVLAPSYLQLLEAETVPKGESPPMTYQKGSQEDYERTAGLYWSAVADLERTGIRGRVSPSRLAGVTADALSETVIPRLFADAAAYLKSADRRNAIHARVLSAIPDGADLVIIAHSLGSVVAADLLYLLPRECRLEMLVTIGSPLALPALGQHLARRRDRFPYELLSGPWVNVVGRGDLLTGCRGLSPVIPEALDAFIDTGTGRSAHTAPRYLQDPTVARALEWLDRRAASRTSAAQPARHLPDLPLSEGMLSLVIGAQHALRLEQAQQPGERRTRFDQARSLVNQALARALAQAGENEPVLQRLSDDNAAFLKDRLDPQAAIDALLAAWTINPIKPYEIQVPARERRAALSALALDLSVPSAWADTVAEAEQNARDAHSEDARRWRRAALAVVGTAVILAAPWLVIAAAPEALAGTAAIVAGLSALGPGGMLGGVGIVGLLGGAGGAIAAGALISGSPREVELTVIHLQARALARQKLGQDGSGHLEWTALVAMEDSVTDAHARLKLFSDDGAPAVQELARKLTSIRRALAWFASRDLAPAQLNP